MDGNRSGMTLIVCRPGDALRWLVWQHAGDIEPVIKRICVYSAWKACCALEHPRVLPDAPSILSSVSQHGHLGGLVVLRTAP